MLTDTHCHLASHRFEPGETEPLIQRAEAAGITRMITLATGLDDLRQNLDLASLPQVHACIGIHPCDVHTQPDDAVTTIAGHTADPRVCAIGETGLDYYHPAPDGWREDAYHQRQRDFLRQHFELAARENLNVVIHTRDKSGDASFRDAIAIYQDYAPAVRAVFHCFIGPWENARRVLDLGGLVSFGGVATFKSAAVVRDTVTKCPAGSFMLETDSPYLAPVPHRGKRNEPSYTRNTADFIAGLRGETLTTLAAHTEQTANGFFRFPAT